MTQTITQLTDFTKVEDAIEKWVQDGSGIPTVFWAGFGNPRSRPYSILNVITQSTPGQPWTSKETIGESPNKIIQTTYYQPFNWVVQVDFYVDSFDEQGKAIRQQARFYAQQLKNRAYMPQIKKILDNEKIAFHPVRQNVGGSIDCNSDDDKYIQQAIIEFAFSGVVETVLSDTDYFETITTPTVNYNEV